jgi:hypothetical protein
MNILHSPSSNHPAPITRSITRLHHPLQSLPSTLPIAGSSHPASTLPDLPYTAACIAIRRHLCHLVYAASSPVALWPPHDASKTAFASCVQASDPLPSANSSRFSPNCTPPPTNTPAAPRTESRPPSSPGAPCRPNAAKPGPESSSQPPDLPATNKKPRQIGRA